MVEDMKTYEQWDTEINEMRETAKRKLHITDVELAHSFGRSVSTLRQRAYRLELPDLSFWAVLQIARASGKEIQFVEMER